MRRHPRNLHSLVMFSRILSTVMTGVVSAVRSSMSSSGVIRLLFALLPIVAFGCGSIGFQQADREMAQSSNVPASAAVTSALNKWTTVKSFRQQFTSVIDGQSTSGTLTFVAPDRVHLVMNIAGEKFESITIGTIEYSRDGEGDWKKTTLEGQTPNRLFADPRQLATLSNNIISAEFAGSESVEGTPARLYRIKHKLPGLETVYHSRLWIGQADSLPLKFETQYEQTLEGLKRTGKSSGIYSDYNSEIRIEPPVM